jgi:hypothetical protein
MLLHDAAVDGLSGSGVFDNDFACAAKSERRLGPFAGFEDFLVALFLFALLGKLLGTDAEFRLIDFQHVVALVLGIESDQRSFGFYD